jgi:hypothetical protein
MIQHVVLSALPTLTQIYSRQRACGYLKAQLRCLPLDSVGVAKMPELRLNLGNWQHPSARVPNFDRLFRRVDEAGDFRLVLWTQDWLVGVQSAYEILNRYQRMLPAPVHARGTLLEMLAPAATGEQELERLRAIDCWRWLHRLEARPNERLERAALLGGRGEASDTAVLSDARDLAFFNTMSWWFLEHRGQPATWSELLLRVGRMSELALCLALTTRQPPPISRMLEAILESRAGFASQRAPLLRAACSL